MVSSTACRGNEPYGFTCGGSGDGFPDFLLFCGIVVPPRGPARTACLQPLPDRPERIRRLRGSLPRPRRSAATRRSARNRPPKSRPARVDFQVQYVCASSVWIWIRFSAPPLFMPPASIDKARFRSARPVRPEDSNVSRPARCRRLSSRNCSARRWCPSADAPPAP